MSVHKQNSLLKASYHNINFFAGVNNLWATVGF